MSKELSEKVKNEFPYETRKKILTSMKEVEFHKHFKILLERLFPDDIIEITHGPNEYGKDLVRVHSDKISDQVYAYVVKVEDLRGNTSGNIDKIKERIDSILNEKERHTFEEIKSQIEQAKTHDAELKTTLKNLKVNHIYVVLVGEFSKNARNRLYKEIENNTKYSGNVECIDIKKIEELFTNHYPEFYFEDKKVKDLKSILDKIETLHYFGKNDISLNDYFVSPRISYLKLDKIPNTKKESISEDEILDTIKESKYGYDYLFHLIKEKKKILLLGHRGTGKTTVLQKITQDLTKKAIKELIEEKKELNTIEVPLNVSAKELLKDDITSENIREKKLKYPFSINVLLVDGLDEIPKEDIDKLITKAKDIAYNFNAGLIITSRFLKDLDGISIEKYKLLDFEFSQAIDLVEKILKKRNKNFSEILERIKFDLKRLEHQIPMFPLSLLMVVEILENTDHRELPSSITEIYDRYMDIILGKWDREKKGLEILFSYKVKQSFLEELAFEKFFNEDRSSITKEEYIDTLNKYIKKHSEIKNIEKFREEIMSSGILKENRDEIEFSHKSFLDYFVAKYLKDYSDDIPNIKDILAKSFLTEKWEDVTFFFIGLKGVLDKELLEKFIDYYKDDEEYHSWSLFRLPFLLQSGWQTEVGIKELALELSVEEGIPKIRDEFRDIASKREPPAPKIVIDMVLFEISKDVYMSIFLKDIGIEYLRKKLIPNGQIFEAVLLLKSFSSYFTNKEECELLEDIIEEIQEKIKEIKNSYNPEKLYISQAYLTYLISNKKFPKLSKKSKKFFRKLSRKYSDSLFYYITGQKPRGIKNKFLK